MYTLDEALEEAVCLVEDAKPVPCDIVVVILREFEGLEDIEVG